MKLAEVIRRLKADDQRSQVERQDVAWFPRRPRTGAPQAKADSRYRVPFF